MQDTTLTSLRTQPNTIGQPDKIGHRPWWMQYGFWTGLALMLATAVLYGLGFSSSLGEFTDAPHHLANSAFVFDALHEPFTAFSNPKAYILNYYRFYPAVNLGYYPPAFAGIVGVMMLILGVSGATAQLCVAMCAVLLAFFCYRWMRLQFSVFWSASTCLLVITAPFIVYWGRDIMLEVPLMAFVVGAIWSFERLLLTDRPTWKQALTWALLSTLALWTKQNALMILPIFLVGTITYRKFGLLKLAPIWTTTVLVTGAAACMLGLLFYVGGDALAHSMGVKIEHVTARFNGAQWLYYPQRLPRVAGWPLTLAAGFGLLVAIIKRGIRFSIPLAWILFFYIMHSYTRAQDLRYATLCVPPLAYFAAIGLYQFPMLICKDQTSKRSQSARIACGLIMVLLVMHSVNSSLRVTVPKVSDGYTEAMADVRDKLGQYTCLTFVPTHPSRPASLYRLATENGRRDGRDILSFGRILRAVQVFRQRPPEQVNPAHLSRDLRAWNVTMILIERPTQAFAPLEARHVSEHLDGLLKLGEFELISEYPLGEPPTRYPIVLTEKTVFPATLSLYQRKQFLYFKPDAAPPIKPRRVSFDLPTGNKVR